MLDYPLYRINGTLLILQPETGKWIDRNELGMDGGGHPVYPLVRNYQLDWSNMDAESFKQLKDFYDLIGNTGTCSVDLPEFGANPYAFHTYSGCTLSEPTCSDYFEEHYSNVSMKIFKIRR